MDKEYYAFDFSLILPANEHIHRRGEASMIKLNNGEVMIAYANHRAHQSNSLTPIEGDNDSACICAVRLSPEGKVLGDEWVLVAPAPDIINVMSPALRWLPDGKLGMLFSYRRTKKEASRLMITSEDEGKTWSEPVTVAEGGYITGCHDRFTVLSDGRLLAPLHYTGDWDLHYLKVKTALSDDCGKTWEYSNPVELPYVGPMNGWQGGFIESGCVEPGAAERADGSLFMCLRTAMGTLFCSESYDRGTTWSRPRSMEVISPQAPAHLSRIPGTKDLLLIWTPNYDLNAHLSGRRHSIMCCVSTDGGRTWPYHRRKLLVEDKKHSVDYPAVLYMDNEVWLTLRRSSTAEISGGLTSSGLMKIPLEWLYSRSYRRLPL